MLIIFFPHLLSQTHRLGPGSHSSATCGISVDVHNYDSWKTPVETWCISSKSFIITVIPAPVTFDSEPHYPHNCPITKCCLRDPLQQSHNSPSHLFDFLQIFVPIQYLGFQKLRLKNKEIITFMHTPCLLAWSGRGRLGAGGGAGAGGGVGNILRVFFLYR